MTRKFYIAWVTVVSFIAGVAVVSMIGATFGASDRRCVTHSVGAGFDNNQTPSFVSCE